MKKQTLFDLASMPKMVLVIVMIVMLGTLFGAVSYLLKTPKIDLPIVNPVVGTQEDYYDVLEKKCAGDDCCLSSLKAMKKNNYKEADKNGNCPDGFNKNMMRCVTSYQWCEPMKEKYFEILLEPKNVALFKKETPNSNNQCVSHPQVVSYSFNIADDRFSLMEINSRQLEKNQEAIENIIKFIKEGEIPKKIIKVSKPSGVVGEKQIIEEERQGVGYLYYDAFHNSCGGSMIDLIGEIEDIFYPGADGVRAVYVWEGQDIPGLVRVRVYAYYKDYVIELSKLISNEVYLEDYLMNIVKKCEKSSEEQCFSKTVASDKILKQKAKETADELVKLFELNDEQITSNWQTYRNEEFGFEIKHNHFNGKVCSPCVDNNRVNFYLYEDGEDVPYSDFRITILENDKELSAEKLVESIKESISDSPWFSGVNMTKQKTEINGYDAYVFDNVWGGDCGMRIYFIVYKNQAVQISFTESTPNYDNMEYNLGIFNQMLSTFKFTEN